MHSWFQNSGAGRSQLGCLISCLTILLQFIPLSLNANQTSQPGTSHRHIVTASNETWHYRGKHSGRGESRGVVRIPAVEGDSIEFRQTGGTHSVFFYVTRPDESELGRRVEVDRNFELPPNEHKLERLSNRLFDREALTTKTFYGNTRIVTILIKENFDRLIYFGCGEHAQEGIEFGIIVPTVTKPETSRKSLPPQFSISSIAQVPSFYPKKQAQRNSLGPIAKIPEKEEILRGSAVVSVGPENVEDGGVEVSSSIFQALPKRAWPDPTRQPWHHITSSDLDLDGDLDLIVAVGRPDGMAQWWAFENNLADSDGMALSAMQLNSSPEPLSRDVFPGQQVRESGFVAVVHVNSDNQPDLVLYNGNPNGSLKILLNARGRTTGQHLVFLETETPIETGLVQESRKPDFIYPYDFDFDGLTDLLIGATGSDAAVFFNAGSRFPADDVHRLAGSSSGIQAAGIDDIDEDGIPDLVLNCADGSNHVYYNNGDREFSLPDR